MSKIPLADENKEQDEGKKLFAKGFLISLIITTVVLLVTAFLIAVIEYYAIENLMSERHPYLHIIADGVGVSGLLGILIYLMSFVSSKGAFDFLSYSVQLLVLNIFNPKYRQEKFPKTYYDYKVLKDSANRKPLLGIIIASVPFLLAGIILLIIYNTI